MTWLPEEADGETGFDRVFGLRPNLFRAWQGFTSLLWTKRLVDPVLLELCRLRIATLHGAAHPLSTRMREARAAGLDEAKVAALERWWDDPRFGAVERACLRFAEQFVLDPKRIDDALAKEVVGALGDAGTVAFVEALAIFDGFARFCRILDVEPAARSGASEVRA
jgi:alkylhydroperoxidase family enzyme